MIPRSEPSDTERWKSLDVKGEGFAYSDILHIIVVVATKNRLQQSTDVPVCQGVHEPSQLRKHFLRIASRSRTEVCFLKLSLLASPNSLHDQLRPFVVKLDCPADLHNVIAIEQSSRFLRAVPRFCVYLSSAVGEYEMQVERSISLRLQLLLTSSARKATTPSRDKFAMNKALSAIATSH